MLVKVGLEPFLLMLLTIKDGQGVPSEIDGLLRVTVTSGAGPEAQAVPHGARTVEVCIVLDECSMWTKVQDATCALTAATTPRAKVAVKSFIIGSSGWIV